MGSGNGWAILTVVAALVAGGSPRTAYGGEVTAADRDAAREAFAEGQELRAKKQYAAALLKFQAAFHLVPSPITALELARSQVLVGQLVEARESCTKVAAMPPKPSESPQAKVARADARAFADELRARIPSLLVRVTGAPGELAVLVDGRPASRAPAKIEVNPGKHHVVARVAGAADQAADVELVEGESREVVLNFVTVSKVEDRPDVPDSGLSPLTYVGFGVAGAGVIVGSIYGVMAIGKRSGPKDGEESYKSTAMISTLSFVVAGVGATVGVIGFFTGKASKPTAAAPRWHPWISIGGAGVTGTF
jgi:hypothetical protein